VRNRHKRADATRYVGGDDNKGGFWMFSELTRELLDLTAEVKGEARSLFAMVIDCCSCSCCGCLFWC
jgi:hypothetical protein